MAFTNVLTGEVLVIGAGPAGLASAYCLEDAGIPYTVVERAGIPASTWANLYASLRLNTAGLVTYLPGKRLPLRYGYYPKGSDLYSYLREYAERGAHGRPFRICYSVTVTRVSPCEQGGVPGWWVEAEIAAGAETRREAAWFPFVIIASGRFGKPYIPPLPGLNTTSMRVLHARDYHTPDEFAGQRVLVAGGGASGGDIAVEVASVSRQPVLLSVRSDIIIARRYPYGLPDLAWGWLARLFIPARWRRAFLDRVIYGSYPEARQLGLTLAPNRTYRIGSGTPVRGRALVDAMLAGLVKPVRGIDAFEGASIVLDDGSRHTPDVVIFSTGYRPAIDYVDFPYTPDRDGWPRRISDLIEGGSTEVRGGIGMHLVGRFYRGLGPLYNIRLEAIRAVAEIVARRRGRG